MTTVKHTPGPWYAPHFADDTCTCNCRSVVSECYAGAICTVEFDNGLRIEDGGNDAPPLDQAKANARLIAAAPDLLEALKSARTIIQEDRDDMFEAVTVAGIESTMDEIDRLGIERLDAVLSTIDAALSKAEGRP